MQLSKIPTLLTKTPSWLPLWRRANQLAAFALIATQEKGEKRYLLQWNEKWQCFNFIGGKLDNSRGDNNDLSRTIHREITEEVGIGSLDNVMVVKEKNQVQLRQFSARERRFKQYLFGIFEISFFPSLLVDQQKVTQSLIWLTCHHKNVFVSAQEVLALQTKDGQPISKTVCRILESIGEIPVGSSLDCELA